MTTEITNMSMEQIDKFHEITTRNKRAGIKNPVLAAVVEVMDHPASSKTATATATPNIDALMKAKAQAKARPAAPANPLSNKTDQYLQQMASHRSSPIADQALAVAELKRRGISYSNGCFSRSSGSARKVSK
jgi:hypothetical protein